MDGLLWWSGALLVVAGVLGLDALARWWLRRQLSRKGGRK